MNKKQKHKQTQISQINGLVLNTIPFPWPVKKKGYKIYKTQFIYIIIEGYCQWFIF